MKKILCLILACFTAFCFAACSKDEDDAKERVKYTYDVDDNFVGEYIFDYFEENIGATLDDILDNTSPLYEDGDEFSYSADYNVYGYLAKFPRELRKLEGELYYSSVNGEEVDYIDFTFRLDSSSDAKQFYNDIMDYFEDKLPSKELEYVDSEFSYIYFDSIHWISFSLYPDYNRVSVSIYTD